MASFWTVAARVRHESGKIKGSRFIATVVPVSSADEAASTLAAVRDEFPQADHHCYAYRLGVRADQLRSSDAGEPSASAGRPILRQIDARKLTNVLVVVTRFFGGTKLGVGGLKRAYGGAAALALEASVLRAVVPVREVTVEAAYECSAALQALLAAAGLEPRLAQYDQQIRLVIDVPETHVESFLRDIGERTAGRARVHTAP